MLKYQLILVFISLVPIFLVWSMAFFIKKRSDEINITVSRMGHLVFSMREERDRLESILVKLREETLNLREEND